MEFIFQVTNYEDPALDGEAVELLRQRLEAKSRRTLPALWKLTDRLEARVKGRRRRYTLQGSAQIALGAFILVLGLMEPRVPILIFIGPLGILAGLLTIYGAKVKSPPEPPASCRREVAKLLAGLRAVDWSQASAEVRFDETGLSVSAGESREAVPYGDMTWIFETERLWLLVYSGEKVLLLQRKDLASGEAGEFLPCLQEKIRENHSSYKGEPT